MPSLAKKCMSVARANRAQQGAPVRRLRLRRSRPELGIRPLVGISTTSGVVHAGAQFRWYEQLCRIRVQRIRDIASSNCRRLSPGKLPGIGGVYCFWWTGDPNILAGSDSRHIELVGPGGRNVPLHFDDEWMGLRTGLPIPLYVGKNADSISKRTGSHLMLEADRVTPAFEGRKKQKRPTTSCQARAGLEHLFPRLLDTRDLVLDNLGLSWVELGGDGHAANRFYLEDLAVGLMRPILNIDIER